MIHQSNLYPMAVKTLTRVGGASIPVVPGTIMSAQTQGSGTLLRVRNPLGAIDNIVVTEAVGTVVADTCLFLVTPIVPFGSASSAKYIRADTVASFEEAPGGTLLILLSDDNGNDRGATLNVSEALATIQSRINTAIASIPESGTWGNLTAAGTTQGTATAITTNNVNITAGGSGRGVRLPAATVGMRVVIKDKTGSSKRVYPATGEFIDERLVNIPFDLPAYGQIELVCGVAGTWTTFRDVCIVNITGNGTTQASTALIPAGTDIANLTTTSAGNTAFVLSSVTIGKIVRIVNTSAITGRMFPASGQQIGSLAVDAVQFIPAGGWIDLFGSSATVWTVVGGTVVPNTYHDEIRPITPTGRVRVTDGGVQMASFSRGGNTMDVGVAFAYETGIPTPGGNQSNGVQVNNTHFLATSCATLGDSLTISGQSTWSSIRNAGVADAYCYCPSGHTMNGVTDGFARVPAGKTIVVYSVADSAWVSSELVNEIVTTVTLVGGQGVVQATAGAGAVAIGGLVAQIRAESYVEVIGLVGAVAGAVSVNFTSAPVAATSITIQGKTELGADAADTNTVRIRIVF